jgi:hypothetical protein
MRSEAFKVRCHQGELKNEDWREIIALEFAPLLLRQPDRAFSLWQKEADVEFIDAIGGQGP